ncbi:MAG: class III cytochrome C family protein [Sphingomonadales bacterium]|nr:class III cytochrome C family protein [Sphingomonadales bacterium]MBK6491493.1 class III cytochrome C family protein [Sphingomonadales bacterium]MBK6721551.1 class III cytochrome C family protein [Sphingomonadales bacterium]MBK8859893.1 class III cytochrome C family protein [Sphingomonadales bacterium]
MKRPGLLAGIGLALATLLVLLFVFPHQMIAPGALIPGHARIQNDCFACHAPLRGASSTRCIVCHVPAQIGVRTTTGHLIDKVPKRPAFHAQLKELDCTACHSDHAANLFAGKRPMTFDHTLLNPAIARNCVSCHAKPKDALHAKIAGECAQCHRTSGWKPANFAHDRYFKLDGEHNVACVTCHVGNAFKGYTCFGCHAHQPAQIAALHAEEGIRDIGDCVRCHRSAKGVEGDREDED